MSAKLDEHLGIIKCTVFIQIKIPVDPSLGPSIIINTGLCNEHGVSNDAVD